jgi:putative hydrolase of the HAD superfamily
MKKTTAITCLLLDIGGVLLTDGWDHLARKRAAAHFKLDRAEMEDRHHLIFEIYEQGKITLEEYLSLVVFTEKRPFTRGQFRRFMFAQSEPFPEMINMIARLKDRLGVKIVIVSNEGRELNAHRIQKFKLDRLADCFISSCFVHIRKPDVDIFELALDVAQVEASQAVFIDNTPMFVQIAEGMGIQSILHIDLKSTRAKLSAIGLNVDE